MAPRGRQFIPIDFTGGRDFHDPTNALLIPSGQFGALVNWIPEPGEYLRVRGNYFRTTPSGAAAPTGGDCIYWSPLASPTGGVFVARASGGTLSIFRADDETSPDWGAAAIDTIAGASGFVPFVTANNIVLYGNGTFTSDRLRFWNGSAAAEASTVAIAGKTLAYYAERFFSGGTDANPTRLYFSGISDHTSWDLNNYIGIGVNDGGTIVSIEPAMGGLLVAKENSVYFLTGNGPSTFTVTRLDGFGEGVTGRSIAPTPYGVLVAGNKTIYLWEGGTAVEDLDMGAAWNVSGSWCSSAFQGKNAFFVDKTGGSIFVRNMETGIWWNENVDSNGNNAIRNICTGGADNNTVIGIAATSTATETSIRTRPIAASDVRDNNSVAQSFDAQTGLIILGMGARPATIKHLHLLSYQYSDGFGGTGQAGLIITVNVNKETGIANIQKTFSPNSSDGTRRDRMDVGLTGYDCYIRFQQTLTSTDHVNFHIKSAVLEIELDEPR